MKPESTVNVAVIGCGARCRRFLEYILRTRLQWMRMEIIGLACPDADDPLCRFADENGIYRTTDYRDLYDLAGLHMLINLLPRDQHDMDIARSKPAHIRLIESDVADIFWDFAQRAQHWQAQLLESEQQFRSLVENSLTGIYINLDERIVFANKRFADIFGYTPAAIIGINYLELVHPEDRHKVQQIHKKRLDGEAAPHEYESRGLTKDGRTVWLNRRNTRIDYGGRPAILGNMVDITQQKQMTEKLIQMEKLASLGTLTAGVAHELNNPLNNMSSSLQIIIEEWDDGDDEFKKSLLEDVEMQVERGQNIIKGLLDFSHTDRLDLKPVDFHSLVNQAIKEVWNQIPENVEIDMQVPEGVEAKLSYYHIQRVLINLMLNAAQAMGEEGGRVTISAGRKPDKGLFCFSVADTGKGIHKAELDKIFDPFYTTKEPSQGTGLGLSITHGIVRQHNGRIEVASEPGKGATFTVCLPEY